MLFDVRRLMVSRFEGITTGLAGCISLILPWCPSVNHVWKQTGRRVVLDPKVEAFRRKVAFKIKTLRVKNIIPSETIRSDCIVMTEFMPPDKRRRDLDNYNKSLWDALTHAGVWKDDSQVKLMLSYFGEQVKGGAVRVLIQPLEV